MMTRLGTVAGRRASRPRLIAAACGMTLVGSTLALAAQPPAAADTDGFVLADTFVTGQLDSGDRCDVTGELLGQNREITGNGRSVTARDSARRTLSAPDDAADATTFVMSSSGRAQVREAGGSVRSFRFDGSAAISAVQAPDAAGRCSYDANSSASFFFEGPFKRGFVRMEVRMVDDISTSLGLNGPGFDDTVFLAGTPGRLTHDVYVDGGEHRIDMTAEASVQRPAEARTRRASGTMRVVGTFTRLGGALGRASGNGKAFITLPGGRACSAGTLTARLGKKAGTARRVVLSVDGKRRATVKQPRRGARVVVRRLPAKQDAVVEARITRRNGTTATVTREYVPCAG